MNEASFASLSPTLLARKGGAKPAMRPQLGPLPAAPTDENLEDLGWNDMGEDDAPKGGEVVRFNMRSANDGDDGDSDSAARKQQEMLAERVAKAKPLPRRSNAARGKRAAFTLRLDAERHLKLKLASTLKGRSAQQLVTEALDAALAHIDDLESLAAQMQRSGK